MTPQIIIAPKARRDLVSIGSYTEKQWGKTPAQDIPRATEHKNPKFVTKPQAGATTP